MKKAPRKWPSIKTSFIQEGTGSDQAPTRPTLDFFASRHGYLTIVDDS